MQYPSCNSDNINESVNYQERAKKARGDRQQNTLIQKQATFDNYGLARPKTRITTDFNRV